MDGVAEVGAQAPEPGLGAAEIVDRARSLRPLLRELQAETERRTYCSEEVHEAFRDAGFYRILQPARFGGLELTIDAFYRVVVEIARGCPSSGWGLCLAAGHAMQVGSLYTAEAQEAIYGDGHFVCAARGVPMGSAEPIEGGWRIDGRWDYCSGLPHSTHVMVTVRLPKTEADAATPLGTAVIPRDGWTMLDDWGELLGMRGSGSHSVQIDGAVVPADWVVPVYLGDVRVTDTRGLAVHGNAMYSAPVLGFLTGETTAIVVGTARAALDEYTDLLRTKHMIRPPFGKRAEDPDLQFVFGTALGLADGAEAILMQAAATYHALAERGAQGGPEYTLGDDLRLSAMLARANQMCVEAMDLIMRNAGASSGRNGSRMQRYWRDMTTFRTHPTNSWEAFARTNGAQYLGVGDASPMATGAA